ncbi:hypothetical protein NMG60_11015108 [Bertholletia excelsa]
MTKPKPLSHFCSCYNDLVKPKPLHQSLFNLKSLLPCRLRQFRPQELASLACTRLPLFLQALTTPVLQSKLSVSPVLHKFGCLLIEPSMGYSFLPSSRAGLEDHIQ